MSYQDLILNKVWIQGEAQASVSGRTFSVVNPANQRLLGEVPDCDSVDTQRAIDSASAAFELWSQKTANERAKLLMAWRDLILENHKPLAALMTAECGKPLAESMGEVIYGVSFIEWFAEQAKRVDGEVIQTPSGDRRILTLRQPVGVCAAITPWNFPLAMIARKVAPALAVGCTMVLKPAEATPLTALALAKLASEAGIPDGVFNVVTASSGQEVGLELSTNNKVRKVTFTGSTAVGKILLKQSADTVKKVSMELGGNAPFIVFDDADIDAAVEGALISKYRNAGQTCVCANRIYVQEAVYDSFLSKFVSAVKALQVGDGAEQGTDIGPLINQAALSKVEELVADAEAQGAEVLLGGQKHDLGENFYQPTVLANCTSGMRLSREEIFGPVAPIFKFTDDKEVIAMANDTEFGLAAYFYSQNMARIWRASEQLDYGMVGVNVGVISTEVAPFGGVKESGLGREGSQAGVEDYLETKYLCLGGM